MNLPRIQNFPYAMPEMISAAMWQMQSPMQIVLAGNDLDGMRRVINEKYLSFAVVMPANETYPSIDGKPTAYVCRDFHCERPVTGEEELRNLL